MSKINWLHLSDIHYSFENYNTTRMRNETNKYLESLGIKFDFIAITGDIAYKNGGYDNGVISYINELRNTFLKNPDDLFIVPGNHDLARTQARSLLIKSINSEENVTTFVNDKLEKETFDALLKGFENQGVKKGFFDFYKEITGREYPRENFHFIAKRNLYNIVHLNTCLISGMDDEEGKLVIYQKKLNEILQEVEREGKSKLNIALGHHSVKCIKDNEQEELLNDFEKYKIDLYLSGHIHKPKVYFEGDYENQFPLISCGSGITDGYARVGLITVNYDCSTGEGKATFHKWGINKNWIIDNEVHKKYPQGIFPLKIKKFIPETQDRPYRREEKVINLEDAIDLYLKHIVKDQEYNSMPVIGKDRVMLDKLYVHLKVTSFGYKTKSKFIEDQVESRQKENIEIKKFDYNRLSPDEALTKFKRLVVIGPPGMGKTTMLHYITYSLSRIGLGANLAGEFQFKGEEIAIPIYCPLTSIAKINKEDLVACIKEYLKSRIPECQWDGILDRLFSEGRILLLLDGLDEISSADDLEMIKNKINGFLTNPQWSKNRLILTCRESNWPEPENELPVQAVLQVAELDEDGILAYLQNRFGLDKISSALILKNQIVKDPRLRELSNNAFLLSLITYLSDLAPLPEKRGDLYKLCTDALLEERHKPKGKRIQSRFGSTHPQLKTKVLADVSFEMMQKGKREIEISELIAVVGRSMNIAEPLLDSRTGDIIEEIYRGSSILREIPSAGEKRYEFLHRQFLEYYAACGMKEITEKMIEEWKSNGNKKRFADYIKGTEITKERNPFLWIKESLWGEVYRLLGGMLKDPNPFLDYIFDQEPTLAARCYLDVDGSKVDHELIKNRWRDIDQKERVKIISGIREKLKDVRQVLDFVSSLFAKIVERDTEVLYQCDQVLIDLKTDEAEALRRKMFDWWPEARRFSAHKDYFVESNFWDFAEIKPGTFAMGSNDYDDEKPIHEVSLSGFNLGRYLITVGQYDRFDPGHKKKYVQEYGEFFKDNNQPVIMVSWYDAYIFCKWAEGRLPTEAEWEYACRAGTKTEYFWGDKFDKIKNYAWYSGNTEGSTKPVGGRESNPWGLSDMIGNVWEWCQDWYGDNYYKESPEQNPLGTVGGSVRVSRGGGWWSGLPADLRSARRGRGGPAGRSEGGGFRLLRAVPGRCQ